MTSYPWKDSEGDMLTEYKILYYCPDYRGKITEVIWVDGKWVLVIDDKFVASLSGHLPPFSVGEEIVIHTEKPISANPNSGGRHVTVWPLAIHVLSGGMVRLRTYFWGEPKRGIGYASGVSEYYTFSR
jgi:hypothetical protein